MFRSLNFWRVFGIYSVLIAVSLGLLGWFLVQRMERHALENIRESLAEKAVFVREFMSLRGTEQRDIQALATELGKAVQTRITVVALDGKVLADSDDDPGRMDNHSNRPEIREAAELGHGTATRLSDTVEQPMMYVALRVTGIDSNPVFVRTALPLRTVEREIAWLRKVVWSGVAIALVLALLGSLWIARRQSAPLVELAQAAREIGRGQCGAKFPVTWPDEWGTLAAAFSDMSQACADHIQKMDEDQQKLRAILNSMREGVVVIDAEQQIMFLNDAAARLLRLSPSAAVGKKLWHLVRHGQLVALVEKTLSGEEPAQCEMEWGTGDPRVLSVDVTRLPGAPAAGAVLVLHDVTHLRRLERHRQEFVANVSHELKTPLAAIKGGVETLLNGAMQDTNHSPRFLQRISENAERLHMLIQDLLTLGRIESGQEAMDLQPIFLESVATNCIARHELKARAQGVRVQYQAPAESVAALADDEALAHILDNLVDNAINYTAEGGEVTLRWWDDPDNAVIEVADTGIGIPEKDLPRIFERFYRVDKARSRELGGTGLGLSIVKHLVQALGGRINVTSYLGKGTTFIVRLAKAHNSFLVARAATDLQSHEN